VNWNAIKKEYIAGGTSYRKLCEKYGVSRTTLQRKAVAEKWCQLRVQAEAKTETKMVDQVSDEQVATANNLTALADKVLLRIEALLEKVDSPTGIKDITTALKNIKDVKGIKTEIDLREQEARIKALEKNAEKSNDTTQTISVVFASNEEYGK
jgi:hypothetical protein